MKSPSPLTKSALCLLLACTWTGCDRKSDAGGDANTAPGAPAAATASSPVPAEADAPPIPVSALVQNAGRLGMAGRMPKDTAFYIGSANLHAHREALEKTQYWKTIEAFLQDKKPSAGKAAQKKISGLDDLKVDDFFLAMSKESNASLAWLIDLNRVYGEYTYRTLMTGFTGGGGAAGSFDPKTILANAAESPELIEKLCALLERAQLPAIMAGVKTAKAQELMSMAFPQDPALRPEWTAPLTPGTLTTDTGAKLTTYSGTLGIWLTPELREKWVAEIGTTVKEPTLLARITQTLETLAGKKFSIAVGVSEGYLIAAAGQDTSHVRFATNPAESLLARPDLAVAQPHAAKNLLGLIHIDAETLTAAHDDQPLTPMLQAALTGLGGTPMFSALTQQLEPKVAALAKAEKDFYQYTFTHANGVFWWDKGLNMDMSGGITAEGGLLDQPLKFAPLLEAPDVLFAAVGHSPVSVTGRAYFERWMDLIYAGVGGIVQAGLGGDQAQATYALVDKTVLPPLLQIYGASKTLYQKGLGTESALVIDLQGQTPLIPGGPEQGANAGLGGAIPRITAVHTVADRKAISAAWQVIEGNLNQLLQSLPTKLPPMQPMSSQNDGLTTWFYPIPIGGNDLLPCVTLNDQLFMFGTSMKQHSDIAAVLNKPAAGAAVKGSHYRFSFDPLRGFLKNAASLPVPGVEAEDVSDALPFIAPFGEVRGRTWVENGQLRMSMHLDAQDVRQVD